LPLHGLPLPVAHGSPGGSCGGGGGGGVTSGGGGGGGGGGLALPWLPLLPLLPPHGLPLPFEQGSPGGTLPLPWSEPIAPLPRPAPCVEAAKTIVPLSTRAVSAAGARFPAKMIKAACAVGVPADANWAAVALAATSKVPWLTTTSGTGVGAAVALLAPVPAVAGGAPWPCEPAPP
jgi:hypothetical protein